MDGPPHKIVMKLSCFSQSCFPLYFPLVVKHFPAFAVNFTSSKHYRLLDLCQKGSWICVWWLKIVGAADVHVCLLAISPEDGNR